MSNCCPSGKGLATSKVFGLSAQGLYDDVWTQTDGSVELTYGDHNNIITDDDNPSWLETFQFCSITIFMKNKLKVSVYDEDTHWNSDILGECWFNLRRGKETKTCMLNHGTLFFSYIVECVPSLSGNRCQEYVPTPMSPPSAKVFYT